MSNETGTAGETVESKISLLQIIGVLVGVLAVITGQWLKYYLEENKHHELVTWAEVLTHLGIGFIVAGAVSAIFDVICHKAQFIEPINILKQGITDLSNKTATLDKDISTLSNSFTSINQQVTTTSDSLGVFSRTFESLSGTISSMEAKTIEFESKVNKIGDSIIDFEIVLKSARENGIESFHRRDTSEEKAKWSNRIRNVILESNEYIFLMGRTLDSLMPAKNADAGIKPALTERVHNNVPLIVLLPDTFCDDAGSTFRREARERARDSASSLYAPTRDTVRQILQIAQGVNSTAMHLVSLRLLSYGPPFFLLMNEKTCILEVYLPYREGGEGLIIEMNRNTLNKPVNFRGQDTYTSIRQSFSKLYGEGKLTSLAIQTYKTRHQHAVDSNRYDDILEVALKLESHDQKAVEEAKLFA